MFNLKALKRLGDSFSPRLPTSVLDDAMEYLEYNEYALALEVLAEQLYEYEVEITNEEYEAIQRFASKMGWPKERLAFVGELVKTPNKARRVKTYSKAKIAQIAAEHLGIDIPRGWTGVDAVLPLLERMREDGAVVLLKWDGERPGLSQYTAVVTGGRLGEGEEFVRTDATTLEAAICHVIGCYSEQVWKA